MYLVDNTLLNKNKTMTQKEKVFIYNLISHEFFLEALDYNYSNSDEKEFIAEHKLDFKEAQRIVKKFQDEFRSKIK